jgi:hypothetical protein
MKRAWQIWSLALLLTAALLLILALPGCNRGDDYPATREGVPGTGGVGGTGTTSANDTTAGQGNYGTATPIPPRGEEAANPQSPASTVLPGTTKPPGRVKEAPG